MNCKGRSALVIGLGKSGVAAARLLLREGARVAAVDDKPAESLRAALGAVGSDLQFLGPARPEAFAGRDLIVKSPGVPRAALKGVDASAEVIGEIELASRFVREPIIGITGTNGKSTTTALTGHLLSTAGLRVFAGGNLGTPLSERVLAGGALDVSVVELSSFQLEDISTLHCRAAAVLNVTPDHLDRYASMDEYAAAKARIFERQIPGDRAVLNGRDEFCKRMPTASGAARLTFGAGDATGRAGAMEVQGRPFALTARTLRGDHNAENAMAAALLVSGLIDGDAIQRGLDSYPGLPHRLEPVRTLNGVEYVNDSKATNVDSVEKSLSAFRENVLILMGGRGKGAPYTPLRKLFNGRVKYLFTLGEDAVRIEAELGDLQPTLACGDLQRALAAAHEVAKPGDVVLLSPACASYDQFKNFEERGARFKDLVRSLA